MSGWPAGVKPTGRPYLVVLLAVVVGLGLLAEVGENLVGGALADHHALHVGQRISVVGQEVQQLGGSDVAAVPSGSAPGVLGGDALCTAEQCSGGQRVPMLERVDCGA